MYYKNSETYLPEGISLEKNLNVCPSNAIKSNYLTGFPEIDDSMCISCGLCVKRCPVGALYFSKELNIEITEFDEKYISESDETCTIKQLEIIKKNFVKKELIPFDDRKKYVEFVYSKVYKKYNYTSPEFCNVLVKNLLTQLGYKVNLTRIGDVYNRMDGVISYDDESTIAPLEIEFGEDSLSSIRSILDDIAMLNYKYNIYSKDMIPLIVFLQLPNKRQGFWQVVVDIDIVTGYNINSITLGVILLANIFNESLDLKSDSYHIKENNEEIQYIDKFDSKYAIFKPKK